MKNNYLDKVLNQIVSETIVDNRIWKEKKLPLLILSVENTQLVIVIIMQVVGFVGHLFV